MIPQLQPTGYHEIALVLQSELVNHGWGELTFRVSSLKDNTVKVEVLCGKSYIFFIKKQIQFDTNLL